VLVPAIANSPEVNITSPLSGGGVIYAASFPYVVPITFTVSHDNLNATKDLDVLVDGQSILSSVIGNAYQNGACTAEAALKLNACSANANNIDAGGTKNWSVPQAGTYLIQVRIAHGGSVGSDEESVEALEIPVEVEYTAPPALANAFLNSGNASVSKKQLTAGLRGCVIKLIAAEHSKNINSWGWGLKPGPYNVNAVQTAANAYIAQCLGQ
jgi:hypothetical protein